MRGKSLLLSLCLCVMVSGAAGEAFGEELRMFSAPIKRDGFHFQFMLGGGAGPTSLGLWHNMEIGGTLADSGVTLGYTHIFLLSSTAFRPAGNSDMFGGHMFLVKVPLGFPELVGKVAVGLGETVDLRTGFVPYFGFGWHVGLDLHIPVTLRSGFTLSLSSVHAFTPQHGNQLGFGLALGYTWF